MNETNKKTVKRTRVEEEEDIEEVVDEENTLDLIYTNESSMVMNVVCTKSNLSDHNRIEITTNIKTRKEDELENKKKRE